MTEKQESLLIVDDEESVRALLQRVMKEAGYNVVTASNGQGALDELSQQKFNAVLLDIKMPGMSGMEVLRRVTANWPGICVVMATAVGDTQTAIEAMKLGAYDYITKPFNRDDVVLKMQGAIAKRRLLLENEYHRLELEKRVWEQTGRLQQQFAELVETLAREHKLLYELAYREGGVGKETLSKLPKELQKPMSSVEEFSEAMLRILKKGSKE